MWGFYGNHMVIPAAAHQVILKELHESHQGESKEGLECMILSL